VNNQKAKINWANNFSDALLQKTKLEFGKNVIHLYSGD